jgi:hypothetical protein
MHFVGFQVFHIGGYKEFYFLGHATPSKSEDYFASTITVGDIPPKRRVALNEK